MSVIICCLSFLLYVGLILFVFLFVCVRVEMMRGSLFVLWLNGHLSSSVSRAGNCSSCMRNSYSIFPFVFIHFHHQQHEQVWLRAVRGGSTPCNCTYIMRCCWRVGSSICIHRFQSMIDECVFVFHPYRPPAAPPTCSDSYSSYVYTAPGRVVQEAVPSFWRWSEDGGAVIRLYASGGNLGLHLGIVSAVRFSVIGTV